MHNHNNILPAAMRLMVAAVVLARALLVGCRGEEFFDLTGEGQLP